MCCLVETSCEQNCQHWCDCREESEHLIDEDEQSAVDTDRMDITETDDDVTFKPQSVINAKNITSAVCVDNNGDDVTIKTEERRFHPDILLVEERREGSAKLSNSPGLVQNTAKLSSGEIILQADKLNKD